MKKILSAFLSLLLIITAVPIAHALNKDGFVYTDNGDGTCTITSYRYQREDPNDKESPFILDVSIPSTLNELKVTGIANNAFKQKFIEEVRIPNTVTFIGAYAFYGCIRLNSVVIGSGVTSIGDHAFYGCTKLNSIVIGSGVTSIGDYAFFGCTKLNSVVIGNAVTYIGDHAFNGCTSLTGINVKNTQFVGKYAFYNCTELTEFSSSSALKTIGDYAFYNCNSLDFLKFNEGLEDIGIFAFAQCSAIPSLKFPDSLKRIGVRAFRDCSALEAVTFGNGALTIEAHAFENCVLLTEVTIPQTVVSIGINAFALRDIESTQFSHNIKINCNLGSAGIKYAIESDAPIYIIELDRTVDNFGDIDGKDGVTTEDARKALRLAASIENEFDEETLLLGDLNQNGFFDIEDARLILSKAAKITPQQ